MDFRTLKAFVEVIKQGSFSKAAKSLFATQSTISKAIKQLEDELGLPLIDRFKTHNTPTAAGELVYQKGLKLIADREDLLKELDELRGLKQGRLRLGISPVGSSTLFAPLFVRYSQRYPDIEVDLIEHGSDQLAECLRTGAIDFAGTLLPISAEFDYEPIRSEPLVALLAANHSLLRKNFICLAELKEIPFILFAPGFALHRMIIDACHKADFEPKIVAQSSQIDFMLELVSAGLGVTFLPRMVASQRANKQMGMVVLNEHELQWNMAMTWRRNAYLSEAAKAWLELLREEF